VPAFYKALVETAAFYKALVETGQPYVAHMLGYEGLHTFGVLLILCLL